RPSTFPGPILHRMLWSPVGQNIAANGVKRGQTFPALGAERCEPRLCSDNAWLVSRGVGRVCHHGFSAVQFSLSARRASDLARQAPLCDRASACFSISPTKCVSAQRGPNIEVVVAGLNLDRIFISVTGARP